MARPIPGTTTFDDVSGTLAGPAIAAAPGLTATADGWDITVLAENSNTDDSIVAAQAFASNNSIDASSGSSTGEFRSLTVTPNDGSTFNLTAVDVGIAGLTSGASSGQIQLVGYRNGVAVSGATAVQLVADGSAATIDVSANSAFQNITSFVLSTDGSYLLLDLLGVDNIVASGFAASGPVLVASSGSAAFVAGDNAASTPVAIDTGLTLADASSATLASATVAITSGFQAGEDVLAFTSGVGTGDIAASYNAGTGVLSLTSAGGATLAQWQAALDSVTYTDTAVTPNAATRTISFTANDGTLASTAVNRDVTVAPTDQTPLVVPTSTSVNYGLSATPITLAINPAVTITDLDNTTLVSATVSLGVAPAGDALGFQNTGAATFGNIAATGGGGGTPLLLTSAGGTATLAQWQAALNAVTFSSTSPVPGTRLVSFAVSDGQKTSADVVGAVNVELGASVLPGAGSASFTAGDNVASTPVAVAPALAVGDQYSPTLATATVAVTTNFQPGEDVLAFTNGDPAAEGDIAASYSSGTGVLTLTSASGTATLAQWQAALASVTYTDTATTPTGGTRTISFTVGDGTTVSTVATRDVTVAATPQTTIVTASGGTATYLGGSAAVPVDAGVTVSDLDSPTLASGLVTIDTGFHLGDQLAFSNTSPTAFGDIAASYNPYFGTLTLTSAGTATLAQWQAALDAVTFSSTSPAPGNRTISFQVSDGTTFGASGTDTITVLHGPSIVTGSGSLTYLANTAAAPVDPTLAVSDLDSATLTSATVSIAAGRQPGDVLALSARAGIGNIAGSYNSGTGVLSLVSAGGTATLAEWQAALDGVTFRSTGAGDGTRSISFQANDGASTGAAAALAVNLLPSTVSGGSVTLSSPITVATVLTLPSGPLVISAPAASPASVVISAGGSVTSGAKPVAGTAGIELASTAGSAASVTVSGASAVLDANGTRLVVGARGAGTLTVSGGGTVRAGANYANTEAALSLGSSAGGSGAVSVAGTGSQLIAAGAAVIGGDDVGAGPVAGGQGSVTVTAGGRFEAGALTVQAGSTLSVDSASALVASALTLNGGSADLGTASAAMPITFGTGGQLQLHALSGADAVNNFTFGDTIDLVGIASKAGVATSVSTSGGTLTLGMPAGVTAYMSDDGNGGTMITPTSQSIGIYRFFETASGVHLYTTSASEAQTIQQTRPDEVFEGVSMTAATPANGDPNAVPIYRFFNLANGSHFYTASATERDGLIATRPDMAYEANSAFYEHLTAQPGDVAVYRFFDTSNGAHFYTDSASERASIASTRPDLVAEGISFYETPRAGA